MLLACYTLTPVHPATGFVCMSTHVMAWMYWPWNKWSWIFLLLKFKSTYGYKILISHCYLLKNNCFPHLSALWNNRDKNWQNSAVQLFLLCLIQKLMKWRVNFHEICFLSIDPEENKALGHKKTNLVFTPQICSYCIFNEQMDPSFLNEVCKD